MGLPVPKAPLSDDERLRAAYGRTFTTNGQHRIYQEEFRSGGPILQLVSEQLVHLDRQSDLYERLTEGLEREITDTLSEAEVEFSSIHARQRQTRPYSRNRRDPDMFVIVVATKRDGDDDNWHLGIDRVLELFDTWELTGVNVQLVDQRAFQSVKYNQVSSTDPVLEQWEKLMPTVLAVLNDPIVPVDPLSVNVTRKESTTAEQGQPTIVIATSYAAPPVSHTYVKRAVLEACRSAGYPDFDVRVTRW